MDVAAYMVIVKSTLLEDLPSTLHASVCLTSSFLQQKLIAFSVKLLPLRDLS